MESGSFSRYKNSPSFQRDLAKLNAYHSLQLELPATDEEKDAPEDIVADTITSEDDHD